MKNLLSSIWEMDASAFKVFIRSQLLLALLAGVVLIAIIESFLYIRHKIQFKEKIAPVWVVSVLNAVKSYFAQQ